jgi:Rps23 Pro-64 3,4-dihydroxylase Tpa1-like proline 4-hydroxylase
MTADAAAIVFTLEDFLLEDEMLGLWRYVLAQQHRFQPTQVKPREVANSVVDPMVRRSRVLMDLGPHREFLAERLRSYVPAVTAKLCVPPFRVSRIDTQLTATNDGEFFRAHRDDGTSPYQTRRISFVLYFNRRPKSYSGGELILYTSDDNLQSGRITVVPRHNSIIFFPSSVLHEVSPVDCPSGRFLDSRFTLNGWFHCDLSES